MSLCEWNPERDEPAVTLNEHSFFGPTEHQGCPNEATVSIGRNGRWHLCESCAVLPRFERFRVRKPLRREDDSVH